MFPTITDLEKAVTDKTRAILLGYPNNPTGAIMSKEQIKAIGDWAVKHDIMIISDELYAHLTYGGKKHTMFTAFPEFKDRTVVLNGFSKAYAMTRPAVRLFYRSCSIRPGGKPAPSKCSTLCQYHGSIRCYSCFKNIVKTTCWQWLPNMKSAVRS